ncbi:hypothetical protein IHQ68_04495 [Chelatococcus sambhunathii]|uniref:Uncharacterized protein n=1 Tax=Chelatococcus sambhunathii TaxID=363953 RepID=A0ABU1DD75_9HYPH|nr:hypothetical protein [Chelatococcus sambhunathii]MDR4305885.1 hypothetical protein [Chelatococcus sambhunathii]
MKTLVHVKMESHCADDGDGEQVFVAICLRTEIAGRKILAEGSADASTDAEAESSAWESARQDLCDQAHPTDPDHVDFELVGSIEDASRRSRELYQSWFNAVLNAIQYAEESA